MFNFIEEGYKQEVKNEIKKEPIVEINGYNYKQEWCDTVLPEILEKKMKTGKGCVRMFTPMGEI
jgi:phage/plasmid-associated DNA primase